MTSLEQAAPLMTAPKLIANMTEIDHKAMTVCGIPGIDLMENAGEAVARHILRWLDNPQGQSGSEQSPVETADILVLCGPGNNGGDGFVCARHLLQAGLSNITVWHLEKDVSKYKPDARQNLDRLQAMKAEYPTLTIKAWPDSNSDTMVDAIEHPVPVLVVDALFGSGLNKSVEGVYAHWIHWVNHCRKNGYTRIVSIDTPSGLDSRTGFIATQSKSEESKDSTNNQPVIEADACITLAAGKPGLYLEKGRQCAGKIEVVDIGIPATLIDEDESDTFLINAKFASAGLPQRPANAHKYQMGHVLVLAGSDRMPGAARLCADAALAAGAGVVTLAAPKSVFRAIDLPCELLRHPLAETAAGFLSGDNWDELLPLLAKADTVLLGPGLGREPETQKLLEQALQYLLDDFSGFVVLDADALNALSSGAKERALNYQLNQRFVLTPHIGEAKRLAESAGIPSDNESVNDRCQFARYLSRAYQCAIVLKSSATVVADNRWSAINSTGNDGMATAGSGDVLAGILAGLLAQHRQRELAGNGQGLRSEIQDPLAKASNPLAIDLTCPNPITTAVYLHGLAGDEAAVHMGTYSLRASHLIDYLPEAFFTLTEV